MTQTQLFLGLFLTLLPLTELRAGLPIVVDYAMKNNFSIWPFFFLVVFLNILVVFLIYFFLNFFHHRLIKIRIYKNFFDKFVNRIRKKEKIFERRFNDLGYFALAVFVAVPLPGSGAWTGTFLAWFFNLDRRKSILAISLGVLVAGLIILFSSYGIFSLLRSS